MKKSIFLFFAAILCAVSMQAKKIYLFPSSDWQSSSAKFGLHTWNASNDSDNKSQLMTKISGVTPVVYEADIPDSHNKVIFLRMNSDANSFDWAKEWTRTQQDIPSDGKNCFFIKNWTESVKWDTYTYTVVGASTMLGSNWNTEDTSNDMVKIDDDNYALVKRNVSLKKNNTSYEYKLVMAHSWDYWSTPSSNAKLTVPADGTYDIMFNYNYKTNKLTCTAVLPQTIYCINTQEWNTVSIHNWLTDKITTTWPGDGMTKTGDKWAGYDIYKKEISGLHKYCIFNNGSKQTSDLTIEGTYYDLGSGKWYNELPTPKFCLKGVFNSWSEDNPFTATTDPNLLTTTVTLSKGTHNFKVAICDLWLGNPGTMERHDESVHEGGWEFKNKKDDGNDADDCKIKADIAGEYIFTWNISSKKLTVTYPTPVFTSGDNSEIISALKNQNLDVKLDRSFKAGELHTLCVPFDIDASLIGTAYQLSNVKAQLSSMLKVETVECPTIEAGKPYLVVPTEDITGPILLKDVTIKDIDVAAVSNTVENNGIKVSFQGILNGGGQTDGTTEYWIGNGGYLYYDVTNKLGLRAMFTITGMPAGMRARVVTSENAATDVENITNSENTTIKVIKNGQLIIIRNGEKFNAQGVRF